MRQLPVQAIESETVGITETPLNDSTAPDHIIENKQTVRFHLRQQDLEIGVVTGFVGVDKREIKRLRWFPSR